MGTMVIANGIETLKTFSTEIELGKHTLNIHNTVKVPDIPRPFIIQVNSVITNWL